MPEYDITIQVRVSAPRISDVNDSTILDAACERVDVVDEEGVEFISGTSRVHAVEAGPACTCGKYPCACFGSDPSEPGAPGNDDDRYDESPYGDQGRLA